jgi:hypothetical protein
MSLLSGLANSTVCREAVSGATNFAATLLISV